MQSSNALPLSIRSDTVPVPPFLAPLIVEQAYILSYIGYAMLTVVAYNAGWSIHFFWPMFHRLSAPDSNDTGQRGEHCAKS